jgi:hypothetical protein
VPARRDAQKRKTRLSQLTDALLRGDKTALQRIARALELRRAQMGRQGTTGATAPRGPEGAGGATGMIGRRRKIGTPGSKTPKGLKPSPPHSEIRDMIVTHFDDVYRQLNAHMRLIAKIQQQVNKLIATAGRLS